MYDVKIISSEAHIASVSGNLNELELFVRVEVDSDFKGRFDLFPAESPGINPTILLLDIVASPDLILMSNPQTCNYQQPLQPGQTYGSIELRYEQKKIGEINDIPVWKNEEATSQSFAPSMQGDAGELLYTVDNVALSILKKRPPALVIDVQGQSRTGGYTNIRLRLRNKAKPVDGIYEFDFIGDAPTGPAPQVITPQQAWCVWDPYPQDLRGVRIYAETNSVEDTLYSSFNKSGQSHGGSIERGYSNNYDLGEAVRDAISRLPEQGSGTADHLSTYTVVGVGAEKGGFAGVDRLYVDVNG